jgi:tetratricopeptide (TPR) repeat protein
VPEKADHAMPAAPRLYASHRLHRASSALHLCGLQSYRFARKSIRHSGCINTERQNYEDALAELEESLRIHKQLANKDSSEILFYIATSLHNLGLLYCAKQDYEKGIEAYESALSIRMDLANNNPSVYLPEASCTLANLSFVYFKDAPNREKSIEYALETIIVLLPI